jgi:WD40 repeat protein
VGAARNHDAALTRRALAALFELGEHDNASAQQALCRLVMHHDLPAAREQVLAVGYEPYEDLQRAVFYFLTGQWDKYEGLDFDHALLRAAYENADERLRKRIAAKARAAGRLEWVEVAAGGRRGRRLASMSEVEWRAALSVLRDHERWQDMWRLAQEAPPRRSVALLRQLQKEGWQPAPADRGDFDELVKLAERWDDRSLGFQMHCRTVLKGHRDEVRCLAFSPNGRLLATGSGDRSVRLWDVRHGKALQEWQGHKGAVNCLVFSPNGRLVASGGRDGTACLWQVPDGQASKRLEGHSQMVTCLAITPDDQILATGSADSSVQLWSLPDGESLRLLPGHDAAVLALAISPDGTILATAGGDSTARLWELPGGRALKTLVGHRDQELDGVLCLAFNPAGDLLATGGSDGLIKLWSLPSGQCLATLKDHKRDVCCLVFSPDGKLLASGGGDHCIHVWEAPHGREVAAWEAHCSEVTQLAFGTGGHWLVSISNSGLGGDQSSRLWSIPDGRGLKSLHGHQRAVNCLALDSQGTVLASGSADHSVRLWTAELARLAQVPIRQASLKDLEWIRRLLAQEYVPDEEHTVLAFIEILLRRYRRHDILVAEASPRVIELGEFDIEIEG